MSEDKPPPEGPPKQFLGEVAEGLRLFREAARRQLLGGKDSVGHDDRAHCLAQRNVHGRGRLWTAGSSRV